MADFYIKQSAAVTPIRARLTDEVGNPADLQNGTLSFVVTSQMDYSVLVNASASILVADPDNLTSDTQANVQYTWDDADEIATPGVYRGEWRFTPNGDTTYQTFPGAGYVIIHIVANNE